MARNLRKHGVYRYCADNDWGSIFTAGKEYRCLKDDHLICNSGNEILIGSLIGDFQLVTYKSIPQEEPKKKDYLVMPKKNSMQQALDKLNSELGVCDPEWDDSKAWRLLYKSGVELDCAYKHHAEHESNWYPIMDNAEHVFEDSVSEPIVFRRRKNGN